MREYFSCNIFEYYMRDKLPEFFHNTQNLIIKNPNGKPIINGIL